MIWKELTPILMRSPLHLSTGWDERWVNISLEGKTVATDIELGYGEWVCKTFTAEVTDGVLECRSRKPEKKQQQAGSGLKLH